MNKKKLLFAVVVLLLAVAFAVSAIMVVNYLKESKEQEELNNQLAEIANSTTAATEPTTVPTETEATEETTVPTETTEPGMIANYEEIYNRNPHTVGWIKMEGTKMNYPVMQTPNDPNYYLERNFEGKYSKHGTIYIWGEADINKPSDNITIFGHNMKDGSMFACLGAYTSKNAWDNNSLIFFDTLNEYHTYKIFAVFATSANVGEGFSYHQFVDAANEEEFNDFVATCKELSFYDTGITPVYGDKLICLSTCTYTLNGRAHDNARLVVAAVRIT